MGRNLVDSEVLNGAHLRERLSALQVRLDALGRLVRCITIGNQTYWDTSKLPDPGQEDVKVQTCTYRQYVDEAAVDLCTFSERLIKRLEECAARWSSGDDQEAFAAFSGAMEGIQWVVHAGSEIHRFDHPEAELDDWKPLEYLRRQFQAVENLMGQHATGKLADAVRYELVPAIQNFVENVTRK